MIIVVSLKKEKTIIIELKDLIFFLKSAVGNHLDLGSKINTEQVSRLLKQTRIFISSKNKKGTKFILI
jgi:hypothetical protein